MSYTLNKTGVQIDAILDRAETGGEIDQDLALKAPLASPALTGTPTAPTPAEGDSSTKIATTEFVAAAIAGAITDTAGPADVVNIPDGSDAEMLSYKASIEPLQDLHGYANPWPAGGGKNMIPDGTDTSNGYVADAYIAADGGIGASGSGYVSEYFPVTAGATYTWGQGAGVASTTLNAICVAFYDNTKTYIPGSAVAMSLIVSHTITAPVNAAYARSTQRYAKAELLQFEAGSSPTVAKPYSNICPISGWTGASGRVTGANLLKNSGTSGSSNGITWTVNADGSITLGGTATANVVIPINNLATPLSLGRGPIDLVCSTTASYNPSIIGLAFQSDIYVDGTYTKTLQNILPTFSFGSGEITVGTSRLLINSGTIVPANTVYYPQIEVGTSASAFSSYNGTAYPIDWTDEAGTVYKGSVDFVSGVLTVTHKGKTLSPSDPWALGSSDRFYLTVADAKVSTGSLNTTIATNLESTDWNHLPLTACGIAPIYGTGGIGIHITGITTLPDFLTWLTNNGGFAVYELATPQTYQLDPVAVRSLLGVNNCWTDTGETEIEYKADLKLYIDKKIAEAI